MTLHQNTTWCRTAKDGVRWGKTSTAWEAPPYRQRECVKCFERKTCTANKSCWLLLAVQQNVSVHGENKIEPKVHGSHSVVWKFFWFQRRRQKSEESYKQREIPLRSTTSNITTEHILTKSWGVTQAGKCWPTCVLSKESLTSLLQKKGLCLILLLCTVKKHCLLSDGAVTTWRPELMCQWILHEGLLYFSSLLLLRTIRVINICFGKKIVRETWSRN